MLVLRKKLFFCGKVEQLDYCQAPETGTVGKFVALLLGYLVPPLGVHTYRVTP